MYGGIYIPVDYNISYGISNNFQDFGSVLWLVFKTFSFTSCYGRFFHVRTTLRAKRELGVWTLETAFRTGELNPKGNSLAGKSRNSQDRDQSTTWNAAENKANLTRFQQRLFLCERSRK